MPPRRIPLSQAAQEVSNGKIGPVADIFCCLFSWILIFSFNLFHFQKTKNAPRFENFHRGGSVSSAILFIHSCLPTLISFVVKVSSPVINSSDLSKFFAIGRSYRAYSQFDRSSELSNYSRITDTFVAQAWQSRALVGAYLAGAESVRAFILEWMRC